MTDIDARIAELEAVSRQRAFTDPEIDEFCALIKQYNARERIVKQRRVRSLQIIKRFLEAR